MPINLPTVKLFIFINRLFINNKDFSFQLDYNIIIATKSTKENNFIIYGNLICYRPYISSNGTTKERHKRASSGSIGGAGTSRTMGRGVTKSYNKSQEEIY